MPDKGIQIIVALLEKRESYLITKDSDERLVKELLRAQSLGYVRKEEKSGLFTLSEKGCRFVYSGFYSEENHPVAPNVQSVEPNPEEQAGPAAIQPPVYVNRADLRPAYASSFLITALFFLAILIIWLLGLG